jgi:hypothetical protein
MSFADSYIMASAEVYERTYLSCKTPEGRMTAQACRLSAGIGAMENAVNPNPVVGMMDMAIMVTLTREISQEPWSSALFGPKNAAAITSTLQTQEAAIWAVVASYLSAEQIQQLRQLAEQWRQKNPDQRFVAGARLADLRAQKSSNDASSQGVFDLAGLNPFGGLDPAVQQIEQSRILAERVFFYAQHLPLVVAWQVDLLYSQILAEPQMRLLLENTNTLTNSTTRLADTANQFADLANGLSQTAERLRQQLPAQQAQLFDQVSTLRNTTVAQLNSSLDSAIDWLYWRLRTLILIAAGSVVGAMLIYRLIANWIFNTKLRR